MSNTKLLKVMDYLINEQEDKARELLHQIFIEKARAIHEEMSQDMDEETLGGDAGRKLGHQIEDDIEEIESEEFHGDGTMGHAMEDTDLDSAIDDLSADDAGMEDSMDDSMEDMDDDEVTMDDEEEIDDEDLDDEDLGAEDDMDDMDDEDMGAEAGEEGEDGERIEDLEQAIEDLKAEFEALRGEVEGHEDAETGETGEAGEMGEEGQEDEVEEGWMTDDDEDLDEDFSDLEEAIDLDEVPVNMKKPGEVGSGKYSRTETNVASPIAKTRPDMGVKPVQIKSKGHTGYNLEAAPGSKEIAGTANRRKKSTDGTTKVSKEGDTRAMLNKDRSDGYGAQNVNSPIGSKGTTPKK